GGAGASDLCAAWEDTEFDPEQRAFYYVRVLENPSCRWSTFVCRSVGVDPLGPNCAAQAAAAGSAFADCCLDQTNDAFMAPVTQERAWTSPIWYRPEAVARLRGGVRFGANPGTDVLTLRIALHRPPADFDPAPHDLVVRLTDDDEIWSATIPAGTLAGGGKGRFVLADPSGHVDGIRKLVLVPGGQRGARLVLRTVPLDLTRADRSDHMVTVALASGDWRATHTRLWAGRGDGLRPGRP